MAAQVASAPTRTNNKNKKLSSSLGPELSSGKSGGGGGVGGGSIQRTGPMLGAGDGTLNNVDHHRRSELNMVHSTSATHSAPDGRDKDGNNLTAAPASTNSTTSSMETGLIANHKLKCAGSGDTPQSHPSPQQPSQFGQFPSPPPPPPQQQQQQPPQQRQLQSTNATSNNGQGPCEDRGIDHHHHGGKENLLGGQGEPQQQHVPGKGEGDLTCKPAERMTGTRYDHSNLGPTGNNSEFNNNYYAPRPCYDQHGGQQQQGSGMAIAHASAHNSMENSHDSGYHNSQYNQYPAYRSGYGGGAYGMMGPSGCRQPGSVMMGSNSSNVGKSALGPPSGGFQRFPGQSGHQQHPSGATPTLNQLLTSPSPMLRGYSAAYQEYSGTATQQQASMALGKDSGPQFGASLAHGWGGQQRNHPHSMSPGNGGQGLGRAQVSSSNFCRSCVRQRGFFSLPVLVSYQFNSSAPNESIITRDNVLRCRNEPFKRWEQENPHLMHQTSPSLIICVSFHVSRYGFKRVTPPPPPPPPPLQPIPMDTPPSPVAAWLSARQTKPPV